MVNLTEQKDVMLRNIFYGLLAIASAYFAIQLFTYHFLTITDPNPQAYREGAIVLTTDYILQGKNPYSMENMPVTNNVYGIVYHLAVLPFAKFLGPGLFTHRMLSGIFILICCFIIYRTLLKSNVSKFYAAATSVILYAALLFNDSSLAKPCSLGTALFLGSVCIPYIYDYSKGSLIISLILGLLAFHTKAYFVLGPFFVGTYLLLFVSKRTGLIYGLSFILLFISTALALNYFFECYFLNIFFNHLNVAIRSTEAHALRQLKFFYQLYLWLILILVAYFYKFVPGFSTNEKTSLGLTSQLRFGVDVTKINSPLLRSGIPITLYVFLWSQALVYFKLGRHMGNWMVYLFELMTPFLLLWILSLTTHFKSKAYLLVVPVLILTMYLHYFRLPHQHYTCPEWTKVRALIDEHHNILNTPAIAPLLIKKGKRFYDSGQTEYFQYSNYPDIKMFSFLFPENELITEKYMSYKNDVYEQVRNKKFDLIILTRRKPSCPFVSTDVIREHYDLVDSVTLCMSHTRAWKNDIWKPKAEKN